MLYIESTVKSNSNGERTPYGEWTINSTLETVSFIIYPNTSGSAPYAIPANTPLFIYRLANGDYYAAFKIARFSGWAAGNILAKSNGNVRSGSLGTTYAWAEYNGNTYYCTRVSTTLNLDSYPPKNDFISVTSSNDMVTAFLEAIAYVETFPITYRNTNCSSPNAPVEAAVGETVTVNYTFPDGYGIVNSSTDIYVTNNGVLVPSNYSNGTLTFTMPDPT